MGKELLILTGSGLTVAWGLAHIAPTLPVVRGLGELSVENRRIVTMAWVAEGLALVFIGVLCTLVALLGGGPSPLSVLVVRSCAVMLVVLAAWTALTGARTSIVAMQICPVVKLIGGALLFLGTRS
jgi:hypothetical protein